MPRGTDQTISPASASIASRLAHGGAWHGTLPSAPAPSGAANGGPLPRTYGTCSYDVSSLERGFGTIQPTVSSACEVRKVSLRSGSTATPPQCTPPVSDGKSSVGGWPSSRSRNGVYGPAL